MIVTKKVFDLAFCSFEEELIKTLPKFTQRVLVTGKLLMEKKSIDEYINALFPDGKIDTDVLHQVFKTNYAQNDSDINLNIDFGDAASKLFGIKPVVTAIHMADIDRFFDQTIPSFAQSLPEEVIKP